MDGTLPGPGEGAACEGKGRRELDNEDSRGLSQEQRALWKAGGRWSLGEGSGLAPINHGAWEGV